jgi:hypothetical protein
MKALQQIAQVSRLLREGIGKALPVSGDQYLTVSIPGTVIDTRDIGKGGSYVWTATNDPFTPFQVLQAEAKLVDNMMPLGTVMIGNTGKSVSRSYARALDCLIPKDAFGSPGKESEGSENYKAAMDYLKKPDNKGKTPIDYYIEKQTAWQEAQSEWDLAKEAARDKIEKELTDPTQIQEAMNQWNQAHFRKFKTNVQGKWMDWVVNGKKYDVENSFGSVDIESIMARVEDSKESWRNSTIVDSDGANEVQTVELTPRNWAQICQAKLAKWKDENGGFSPEQLDAEIDRLTKLNLSFEALKAALEAGTYPWANDVDKIKPTPDMTEEDKALQKAYSDLYIAQGKLDSAVATKDSATPSGTIDDAVKEVNQKQKDFHAAEVKYNDRATKERKWAVQNMPKDKAAAYIDDQQKKIKTSIESLTKIRDELNTKKNKAPGVPVPTIAGAEAPDGDKTEDSKLSTDMAPPNAALPNPIFQSESQAAAGTGNAGATDNSSDPWTSITVSYSAKSFSQTQTQSSWGMSVSGGLNFGLFSMGGSYSHEESKSDMYQDMSECDVTISFQAMVVNIRRPWLYGELFGDYELDVAKGMKLSPGPQKLQEYLKNVADPKTVTELQQYTMFPSYPTSFVVAADTVIEFTGSTSHIEQHFSSHSNSGSMSVGYGPFSMSGR